MGMYKSVRIRIVILALMLAVSHIALVSHVTAHFEPELEPCELCVSQAQLLTAIPTSDHDIPVDPEFGVSRFVTPRYSIPVRHGFAYHQRAPPVTSS
jgi:hypothetical protein